MWTDLVAALPVVETLHPPASEAALRDAAEALGHPLPEELVALLRESDGVEGEYGMGLIWPVERIVADNRILRDDPALKRLYMPFDPPVVLRRRGQRRSVRACPDDHTPRSIRMEPRGRQPNLGGTWACEVPRLVADRKDRSVGGAALLLRHLGRPRGHPAHLCAYRSCQAR